VSRHRPVRPLAYRGIAVLTACHGSAGAVVAARPRHGCVQCSCRREPLAIGGSRLSVCRVGRRAGWCRSASPTSGHRPVSGVAVTRARGMATIVLSASPIVHRRCPRPVAVTAGTGCVDAAVGTSRTCDYRPAPPVAITGPHTETIARSATSTVRLATGASATLDHRCLLSIDVRGLSCALAAAGDTSRISGYRRISPVSATPGSNTPASSTVTVDQSMAHPGRTQTLIYRRSHSVDDHELSRDLAGDTSRPLAIGANPPSPSAPAHTPLYPRRSPFTGHCPALATPKPWSIGITDR
jgi:hypothetical protein